MGEGSRECVYFVDVTFDKGSCSPCQSGGLRKCPIKKSHMHATDPVVHVTVWWIKETPNQKITDAR